MLKANSRILPIEDIKIPEAFAQTTPGRNKVEMRKAFYKVAGKFDKEIIVDRKGCLFDGYSAYIAAKELGLDKVPVVQVVPFKAKKKVDEPANKYEGMSNTQLGREMCSKGMCYVYNGGRRKHDCLFADDDRCSDVTDANRADVIKYLLAEDAEAEPEPEPEYYNETIVCISKETWADCWTVGKTYIVKDGQLCSDNGSLVCGGTRFDSLDDINRSLSGAFAKFVDGEAHD